MALGDNNNNDDCGGGGSGGSCSASHCNNILFWCPSETTEPAANWVACREEGFIAVVVEAVAAALVGMLGYGNASALAATSGEIVIIINVDDDTIIIGSGTCMPGGGGVAHFMHRTILAIVVVDTIIIL